MKDHLKSKSQVEIFKMIIDENSMNYVVLQSTAYACQNKRHTFQFLVECLQKCIGILLFAVYHLLPKERIGRKTKTLSRLHLSGA